MICGIALWVFVPLSIYMIFQNAEKRDRLEEAERIMLEMEEYMKHGSKKCKQGCICGSWEVLQHFDDWSRRVF